MVIIIIINIIIIIIINIYIIILKIQNAKAQKSKKQSEKNNLKNKQNNNINIYNILESKEKEKQYNIKTILGEILVIENKNGTLVVAGRLDIEKTTSEKIGLRYVHLNPTMKKIKYNPLYCTEFEDGLKAKIAVQVKHIKNIWLVKNAEKQADVLPTL